MACSRASLAASRLACFNSPFLSAIWNLISSNCASKLATLACASFNLGKDSCHAFKLLKQVASLNPFAGFPSSVEMLLQAYSEISPAFSVHNLDKVEDLKGVGSESAFCAVPVGAEVSRET